MAREATSAHLDSMIHYYKTGPLQGTTARLYVSAWDRNTVADGYWQTVNTIQPLINRDIYLADAIDKLAEKHTVYNEGYGINISNESDGTHYISVDPTVDFINVPTYNFDNRYFTTAAFGFFFSSSYIYFDIMDYLIGASMVSPVPLSCGGCRPLIPLPGGYSPRPLCLTSIRRTPFGRTPP